MTTWYPDTCGCSITLNLPSPDFDWQNIDATHIQSVTPCVSHASTGAPIDVFNQVCHNENRIKNLLLAYVQQNRSSLQVSTSSTGIASATSSDSATSSVASDNTASVDSTSCAYCSAYGVPGALSFDANRVLQYQSSGLDTASLQAWADSTFGAGKVVVG